MVVKQLLGYYADEFPEKSSSPFVKGGHVDEQIQE